MEFSNDNHKWIDPNLQYQQIVIEAQRSIQAERKTRAAIAEIQKKYAKN